jgi:chemotaxis response regulator CheB
VVTATVEGNATRVYDALGAGALDAVQTPVFGQGSGMLLVKLDLLEKRIKATQATPAPASLTRVTSASSSPIDAPQSSAAWLVGIGASAGGPAAVAKILSGLPKDFPGAIVVVQHIDSAFCPGLISWLAGECGLPVAPALHGTILLPGHVYVAGGDKHLVIDRAGGLAQTDEPRGGIYLPSIDVFFSSMALNWREAGTGVLLTGMGRDGARGLLELRSAGFTTITQDRATSSVYGMPKVAAELNAATHVLPLDLISAQLRQLGRDSLVAPVR